MKEKHQNPVDIKLELYFKIQHVTLYCFQRLFQRGLAKIHMSTGIGLCLHAESC